MLKLAPGTLIAPRLRRAKFIASLIIDHNGNGDIRSVNGMDLSGDGHLQIVAGAYADECWSVLWLAA